MKIACLGDSLTGPSPGAAYLDKYLKWPDLLGFGIELLGREKVAVFNRGRAGDTSSAVCADLKRRLLECDADIVIVLLGANNYSPQNRTPQTPELLKSDLIEIVRHCRAAQSHVLLLQYPDPKADKMEKVWTHGNLCNPIIGEVAFAENVPLLNLKPSFDEAGKVHLLAELASPIDGVHLSPGGELVLARAVIGKLRELKWI